MDNGELTKILVVEDEGIVAMDIKNRLIGLGYAVPAVVFSGEEAIKKAAETHPDLVLMDIRLKGEMNGIEAAEQIRDRFHIPVVYLTAYTNGEVLQRAKVTEPFAYILKPFEERELHSNIEIALYRHKMEMRLKEREQWLAVTLKSIGDAVLATDARGLVTFMNPVAEGLLGLRQEDVLGKDLKEVFNIIKEETHTLTENPVMKTLREGVVDLSNHMLLVRDGVERPVDGSIAPIRDDRGYTNGAVLVLRDITERKRAEEERRQSAERLLRAMKDTVHAMALTVEMRDPYTAGHQRGVVQIACAIAKEMSLSENQIDGIRMAGIIHDIGKISVPAEILSKTGRITENEFGIIRTHPQVAYNILKGIDFPWPVAQVVLQHHERMDGSGYPQGLSGEEILLAARILGVADVVEAMASHRPYREALGIDKALEEISQNRGVFYDPDVVDACLRLFREKGFLITAVQI